MLLFLKKQKVFLIFLVLLVISMKVDLLLFILFSYLSIAYCINLGKVFIHYYTTIKFDLNKVNKELLSREILNLPDRDKEIMILRYGLNNKNEYTQKEVAQMLGISQSYISRIEKKVVRRLKQEMVK